jgi:hypothetical protein
MAYSIERIKGHSYDQSVRRVVVFLFSNPEEPEFNAKKEFDALKDKHRFELQTRFDHWQRGEHKPDWHHGWNEPAYQDCYVFKRKEHKVRYRYYGFLVRPRLTTDGGFTVCVLVSHASKSQEETDKTILNRMSALANSQVVIQLITKELPEHEEEEKGNATLDSRKHKRLRP